MDKCRRREAKGGGVGGWILPARLGLKHCFMSEHTRLARANGDRTVGNNVRVWREWIEGTDENDVTV